MVATPVVEVGIDIPNATIMVIEASERFGLLSFISFGEEWEEVICNHIACYLLRQKHKTLERLRGMERIHIGAELAELDLRLRGG